MLKRSIGITCAVFLFAALVCAQESPDGHWESVNNPIGITLDLTKNVKSEWVASMVMRFPAQNARGPVVLTGLAVQRVTVNGASVSFVIGEVEWMMSKFDLTLGAGGTMKGTITSPQRPPESVEFKRTGEAKWVAANPDDPQRWLIKAMAQAEANLPEEALKSFNKLIELMPNDGSNWVGRGQMLEELKRDDEALKAFDKATTLSPWHNEAWNFRGGVLLRLGKYDEAIKSYDKALELNPRWADSFYNRACAYAGKGDKANALADLKQAIELQPSLKAEAGKEDHFSSLRNDPEFRAVLMVIQSASVQDALEGVWQYTEIIPPGADAKPIQIPPGSLLIFTKKHYSLILIPTPRPDLPQQYATDAQKVATWEPFMASAGTYEVEGNTFTAKSSAAKNPSAMAPEAWITNEFKIEGNMLITTPKVRNAGPVNLGSTKLVRVE